MSLYLKNSVFFGKELNINKIGISDIKKKFYSEKSEKNIYSYNKEDSFLVNYIRKDLIGNFPVKSVNDVFNSINVDKIFDKYMGKSK